jgi:hypothetical protein
MPLMSSNGGPSPVSSTCSRMPSTSTCTACNLDDGQRLQL